MWKAWLAVRKAREAAEEAGVAPPSATGMWKFNKNTQAWLLRHVFSEDQVGCLFCRVSLAGVWTGVWLCLSLLAMVLLDFPSDCDTFSASFHCPPASQESLVAVTCLCPAVIVLPDFFLLRQGFEKNGGKSHFVFLGMCN